MALRRSRQAFVGPSAKPATQLTQPTWYLDLVDADGSDMDRDPYVCLASYPTFDSRSA